MPYPLSTGQVATVLGRSEPQVADAIRRRKVDPPPPKFAGRRMWGAEHVRQIAAHFGMSDAELSAALALSPFGTAQAGQHAE